MFARLGGVLAPIINMLYNQSPSIPLVIFGTAPLLGAVLALALPETANKPLPDTVEDAENWDLRYNHILLRILAILFKDVFICIHSHLYTRLLAMMCVRSAAMASKRAEGFFRELLSLCFCLFCRSPPGENRPKTNADNSQSAGSTEGQELQHLESQA